MYVMLLDAYDRGTECRYILDMKWVDRHQP